ncbi:MAG: single-stranded-DNA-specific exonuclease RecJ [Lachnospiraceae bacterium]|nr:single-stranded-DNA-specific exonuclease RecJ [Lachnospiraceae bacterium]
MSKWMVSAKRADFKAISESCGISPVLARLIRNRGVTGADDTRRYLYGTVEDLYSPLLMHGMEEAAAVLERGIREDRRIRVIGDYDVDGICASYIFCRVLSACGARADATVPDRVRDGYGMNVRLVREAAEQGVEILLTCDNGISAAEAVREAGERGMTVVVTDHHEVPYTENEDGEKIYCYPPADALVDPVMRDPGTGETYYPFPSICGAVTAWKVSDVLMDRMGCPQRERLLHDLLPFCALATVCDVMPLKEENRIIVREGLRIAEKTDNIGLAALIGVTGLSGSHLTAYHAGFILGPCLNASGRLDTALRGLHLFMETDRDRALRTAQELKDLNDRRKSMTASQTELAIGRIGQDPEQRVLVVLLEECHESLAGIIAGRIRERFYRPAIVLTQVDDALLKGSGRSVPAYDMYGGLSRCSDLFEKFGGHKMAVGLTIRKENLGELTERLNALCTLTEEDLTEVLHIDMELPPCLMGIDLTREMEQLEPCGTDNPKALFVTRDIRLLSARVLGKSRNVVKFRGADDRGNMLDLVCFGDAERTAHRLAGGEETSRWKDLLAGSGSVLIDMVFYPDINAWNGRETMQYIIRDYRVKE